MKIGKPLYYLLGFIIVYLNYLTIVLLSVCRELPKLNDRLEIFVYSSFGMWLVDLVICVFLLKYIAAEIQNKKNKNDKKEDSINKN